jgi:hypothetical protein
LFLKFLWPLNVEIQENSHISALVGQEKVNVWRCLNSWTNFVQSLATDVQAVMDGWEMDIVMIKTTMLNVILTVVIAVDSMLTKHIVFSVNVRKPFPYKQHDPFHQEL